MKIARRWVSIRLCSAWSIDVCLFFRSMTLWYCDDTDWIQLSAWLPLIADWWRFSIDIGIYKLWTVFVVIPKVDASQLNMQWEANRKVWSNVRVRSWRQTRHFTRMAWFSILYYSLSICWRPEIMKNSVWASKSKVCLDDFSWYMIPIL